jgi:hypothetical protein
MVVYSTPMSRWLSNVSLQIEVERGLAFGAAVMLEAGRMDAACPAVAQRTTLEAVTA